MSIYLAYIAGLTVVVCVLAAAAAAANSAVVNRLRRVLLYVNRISGALLVLVGLYVGYYALYEIRMHSGQAHDALITAAAHVQGALAGWVYLHRGWPWALALAVLMAGAVAAAWYRRARRSHRAPN